MSIDDLTLTDLTIVKDTDVEVKIYCDCAYVDKFVYGSRIEC